MREMRGLSQTGSFYLIPATLVSGVQRTFPALLQLSLPQCGLQTGDVRESLGNGREEKAVKCALLSCLLGWGPRGHPLCNCSEHALCSTQPPRGSEACSLALPPLPEGCSPLLFSCRLPRVD